jgi:hypothetical protein
MEDLAKLRNVAKILLIQLSNVDFPGTKYTSNYDSETQSAWYASNNFCKRFSLSKLFFICFNREQNSATSLLSITHKWLIMMVWIMSRNGSRDQMDRPGPVWRFYSFLITFYQIWYLSLIIEIYKTVLWRKNYAAFNPSNVINRCTWLKWSSLSSTHSVL